MQKYLSREFILSKIFYFSNDSDEVMVKSVWSYY